MRSSSGVLPEMNVRVSYVATTRNRKEAISKALAHWRDLKSENDELIVVDGNSTDGTYDLLCTAECGLIDCLIHEPDLSEAHAFNKGFLAARGTLIKTLTDDDHFYKDGLEKAYQVMLSHPEIDMLNTGGECGFCTPHNGFNLESYQYARTASHNPYWRLQIGVGLVVRRESLALIGLIDPTHFYADTSWIIQAMHRGANVRFLQVKAFRYQGHPGSGSQKKFNRRRERQRMLRGFGVPLTYRLLGIHRPLSYVLKPTVVLRGLVGRVFRSRGTIGMDSSEPVWDGQIY